MLRKLFVGVFMCVMSGAQAQQAERPAIATTKVDGTEGVYIFRNVNHQAMFVVTNDGVLLTPINDGIPTRKVWDPLACPLCGAALVHDGQLHTADRGWW